MLADNVIDPQLLDLLRCPTSGLPLKIDGDGLVSGDGSRRYPVVGGVPCLMPDSAEATHAGYRSVIDENRKQMQARVTEEDVVAFVQSMIVSTCGNLSGAQNSGERIPSPTFQPSSRSTMSWRLAAIGDVGVLLEQRQVIGWLVLTST
jgi:uncharacterized protein YbaR (Trm112 family)